MKKKYSFKCQDSTIKHYDFISKFIEGFAAVNLNDKWGFIDEAGNEICPIKYEQPFKNNLFLFSEGYAAVGIPKGDFLRFGYINTKGKEVCPFIYTGVFDFHNGLAIVRDENMKWYVIDKNFKKITKRSYDMIDSFHNSYAIVKLNGLYGFIDSKGNEICKIKYTSASHYFDDEGFAIIGMPNNEEITKVYYINTKGEEFYSICYMNKEDTLHPLV